ncbi:MAG: DNA-formamidopyrimidine glycosylase [Gammaproteobacteria bacterium]|nr:DNA-formamidopyrimidine glycosylase [Gammaproteobacteria bacterium]
MPELPEVETTRLGLSRLVKKKKIVEVIIRQRNLRWPIEDGFENHLRGSTFTRLSRRGKYLLFHSEGGRMMVHLGMSGSLRVVPSISNIRKHDHVDICFDDSSVLRYHDPRRFGSFFWLAPKQIHKLLKNLGPEPLSKNFDGNYLYEMAKHRRVTVKTLIMNSSIVVGVGNIYANEALFLSGIRPDRLSSSISKQRYKDLVNQIKRVLNSSIRSGGTTLRDFVREGGQPGYFKQRLFVYGRGNQICKNCTKLLRETRINNRSTFFCPRCQT